MRPKDRNRVFLAIRIMRIVMFMVFVIVYGAATTWVHGQDSEFSNSISSNEFLQSLDPKQWNPNQISHPYPRGALPSHAPHEVEAAVHAENASSQSEDRPTGSVVRANFDGMGHPPDSKSQWKQWDAPTVPATASVGPTPPAEQGLPFIEVPQATRASNVVNSNMQMNPTAPTMVNAPVNGNKWKDGFTSFWSWNADNPRYLIEAHILSLRRSNDAGGSVSTSEGFDRNGRALAGRYTFAMLNGSVDRTEWTFTGPLEWERSMGFLGPSSTNLNHGQLPSSSLGTVNASDEQTQLHTSSLSSYEWNRSWSGDGMSSFATGFKLWDYDERYVLQARQSSSMGEFRKSADNLLAGAHMRLFLSRPVSQRLSYAFSTDVGWYANFAKGSYVLNDNSVLLASNSADRFRMTWVLQPSASLFYRLTQNTTAFCGYEAVYFTGVATVSDLRLGNVAAAEPFSVRAKDDQLFYGWTAGINARF